MSDGHHHERSVGRGPILRRAWLADDLLEEPTMKTDTTQLPLALRPRNAARVLGISPRLLWSLSAPRGPIPCTRIGGRGGAVLYRLADLDAWLQSAATRTAKGGDDDRR